MTQNLIKHLNKYIAIHPDEERDILSYFEIKSFRKKDLLLQQNSICKYHYFVLSGCLRLFFIDEKGYEQTLQFALENWWMTDNSTFEECKRTQFNIQAIENTEVLQISHNNQEQLLHKYPKIERYLRLIYQRAYSASIIRAKYLHDFSREEFYLHFIQNFPHFAKRIPQHILATYLHMTPEYLSEIKKKVKS